MKPISQNSIKSLGLHIFVNENEDLLKSILNKSLDTVSEVERNQIISKWLNKANIKKEINIALTTAAAAKIESKNNVLGVSINSFNKLTLYPNPVGDILNIKTSKGGNMAYKIINTLGQVVNEGKTSSAVIVDDLDAGMYYIEVDNNGIKMMKRFIKE